MVLAGLLAGCSQADSPVAENRQTQAVFNIQSRADGEALTDECLRLFIADRRQEHNNTEALHCGTDWRIDLESNQYTLSDMLAQWYKFAFVSVPDLKEVDTDGKAMFTVAEGANENTCDFNKLAVNYGPVLDLQQDGANRVYAEQDKLDVWRTLMDRWLLPDEVLTENVTLKRLTGRLVLNLGIPEDQFRRRIAEVRVVMYNVPQTFLIHDGGEGLIMMEKSGNYVFTYKDIPWPGDEGYQKKDYVITLAMPPHEVNASLVVVYEEEDIEPAQEAYPIVTGDKANVTVRANTRTLIQFNGMEAGAFEVRYAGFDGSGIDVADDDWNGWPTDGDNGQGSSPGDGQDNGQGNGQDSNPDDGQDNGQEGGA